jgi:inward rectifier potassium channel
MNRDRILPKSSTSTSSTSKHRKLRTRIVQIGSFKTQWLGEHSFHWSDLYHALIVASWPKFFSILTGGYFLLNALFACAYLLGSSGIENARPGSFNDVFFFSVQTMASIGYGAMYPKTPYIHSLVTIEALVGVLGVAMATGLMFARFSRPTARALFSKIATICPYNGVPTLMFRVANQRHNSIVEAQVRVNLLRSEVTAEGHSMRRLYELPLTRQYSPIFALSWMVMHPIDAESPLSGETLESAIEKDLQIIVTLTGLDSTVSQTVHANHLYHADALVWDRRFVDVLHFNNDGDRYIDYPRFHDTETIDS